MPKNPPLSELLRQELNALREALASKSRPNEESAASKSTEADRKQDSAEPKEKPESGGKTP